LIAVANLGLARAWARALTYVICGVLAGFTVLYAWLAIFVAALRLFQGQHAQSGLPALELLVTGSLAGLVLLPAVRSWVARYLPLDPDSPVHVLALVLTILVAGSQLWLQLSTDVVAEQAATGVPVGRLDLVAQELPLLLAALVGVGLWLRRPPAASAARMGWLVPRWWHVLLGVGAAGVLYALGNGFDVLSHVVTPDLARKLDASNQRLLGHLADPVGIATIAVTAGICEEALFRGALQPRLGIIWTSLVFASVHTQYGLSFDTLAVLVLGFGLGLLRHYLNTTTSTITHVVYNTLAGTGLGPLGLYAFAAVDLALLAAGAYGLWSERSAQNVSLKRMLRGAPDRQ
jgi:membrane protease YdiL (CAAX protease family)